MSVMGMEKRANSCASPKPGSRRWRMVRGSFFSMRSLSFSLRMSGKMRLSPSQYSDWTSPEEVSLRTAVPSNR